MLWWMGGRIWVWLTVLATASACTRDNPEFELDGPKDTEPTTTPTSTGPPSTAPVDTDDPTATSGSPPGSATDSPPGDSTGIDSTTSGPMMGTEGIVGDVMVYATQPYSGGFSPLAAETWMTAIERCRGTITAHFAEMECANTWPLLPIDGIPLQAIPMREGGVPLSMGPVYAPDGSVAAQSFDALAHAMVPPGFADAVSAHLTPDGTDLQVWWGQLLGGGEGSSCENWTNTKLMGSTATFDAAPAPAPPLSGFNSCAQSLHLLCVCF